MFVECKYVCDEIMENAGGEKYVVLMFRSGVLQGSGLGRAI